MQPPFEQTLPVPQACPHEPQLFGSDDTSVQEPAHSMGVAPSVQAQALLMHCCVETQAVPQLPQLRVSSVRFTHAWPHCVRPVAQLDWHMLSEHTWLAMHATPQPP